jgi:hypothetical protein
VVLRAKNDAFHLRDDVAEVISDMPPNQRIFASAVAVVFLLVVLDLARRKKLRVEYSILWSLTAAAIIVLVFWYDSLLLVTKVIGAVLPTTTLFIFGLMFLLFVNLHFSVKVSELSEQVKNLAHELALHTVKKGNKENETTGVV